MSVATARDRTRTEAPGPAPPPSLRDRFERIRTRILSSPAFRSWSASFPLTRPIARRRARRLFDLSAGFVYSQVLLAVARLGIFDRLADGPVPLATLADDVDLHPDALRRLVTAATPLQLLRLTGTDRVALGTLGAPVAHNAPLRAMLEHNTLLYHDLAEPQALLRGDLEGTRLGGYWPYAAAESPGRLEDPDVEAYSRLMTASQPLVGDEVLQACDFRDRAHLLDIGGGEGGFLLATAERYAHLELTLFDLPPVARRARRLLDASDRPEARRIRTVGGDFFTDSLPGGADVITLLRVLLDHDDPRALRILRAAHQALAPGGTLVVAEATVDGHGAERVGATYFNLYLLALGSGRARSRAELTALLRQAGFRRVRSPGTRLPIQTSVLTAIR